MKTETRPRYLTLKFLRPTRLRRFAMEQGQRWLCRDNHGIGKSYLEALETSAEQFDFDRTSCPVSAVRIVANTVNHCDHGHATRDEVRVLPTSGGGNTILCRRHYGEKWNSEEREREKPAQKCGNSRRGKTWKNTTRKSDRERTPRERRRKPRAKREKPGEGRGKLVREKLNTKGANCTFRGGQN